MKNKILTTMVLFVSIGLSVSVGLAGAEGHGNDSFRDRLEEAQKMALGHLKSATEEDLRNILGEKSFQMFFSRKDQFIEKATSVTPDRIKISETPIVVLVNNERKSVEARAILVTGIIEFSRPLCGEHSLPRLVYSFLHEVGHLVGYDDHFERELSEIALGLLTVRINSSDKGAIQGLRGELLKRYRQMIAHATNKPIPDFSPFFEMIQKMKVSSEYQILNHEGRCKSKEKCEKAREVLLEKWQEVERIRQEIVRNYDNEWQTQYDQMSEDCSQWGESFSDLNQRIFIAASQLQISVAVSHFRERIGRAIWDRVWSFDREVAEAEKRGKPLISFVDFAADNVRRVYQDELSEVVRKEQVSFLEKVDAILRKLESLTPYWEKG